MSRLIRIAIVIGLLAWGAVLARPSSSTYTEPVVLSAEGGTLEVVLSARQGKGRLDTCAEPVDKMLLFSYRVVKGQSSNGQMSAENLYPGPTLSVQPGETLTVHLENEMAGLTIADFFDPAYAPAGTFPPKYPPPITRPPFNLHTHGLHVSPMGNSDNVLLSLAAGSKNTYSFRIPKDHAPGMYWYHGHLHSLTTAQCYYGLAGMLIIGRPDGYIPAVTQNDVPVRSMALQYNFVVDRKGGQHTLNNPNWGQFVSTRIAPEPGELESGAYEPSLAPVNFNDTAAGTRYISGWYAGNLSIGNKRGQFELIPNNLLNFKSNDGQSDITLDPSQPDADRDVQFTVNGQFQPRLKSRPGGTEIWVLANVSDLAYIRVRLTETATGEHPPIVIVGQDGLAYHKAQAAREVGGTVLTIPPASRYVIAVTIPKKGELVLDMPPAHDLHAEFSTPAVVYTSQGKGKRATGTLGTVTTDPKFVSYFDGFFLFPTQELVRAVPTGAAAEPVAFVPGQDLGAPTNFFDTRNIEPDVKRETIINGGFLDKKASSQEPKAFIYAFDSRAFPHTPMMRPRLGSVEEWSYVNYNNDGHPIHIHVNDFQVSHYFDPVENVNVTFQPWAQDNANVAIPLMSEGEKVIAPARLSVRTHFEDFLGSYVVHCHRLNHEDNGLMALINVIPAVSSYASARQGTVTIRDNKSDAVLATVKPFPGYSGALQLSMGDVNGDAILDLVAANSSHVAVYSGAGKKPFVVELARFAPFGPDYHAGLSVAAGNLDGSPGHENIVVGSGPGVKTRVKVFNVNGPAPKVVGDFSPYPEQKGGVSVAVGMIEASSGLFSIITAPGPGQPALVRAWRYELENEFCSPTAGPTKISEFQAFDKSYQGGVTLACEWPSTEIGGAQMVAVGQRTAPGEVRLYSTGSALDGYPGLYTVSPIKHDGPVKFHQVCKLAPFAQSGAQVAMTSTIYGADLLVSGGNELRKYELRQADEKDTVLTPKLVRKVQATSGTVGGE